jgi:ectoine hydroxylase-related dioxygenase (phytanoyl-CoA dioxygenase family)
MTDSDAAASWRRAYQDQGFLVVPDAVDMATITDLRTAMERIEQQVRDDSLSPALRRWVSLERDRTLGSRAGRTDNDGLSNVMELPLFDPLFARFIVYPRLLDVLEALFESTEFAFHNYKCICKMPHNEAHFQWHRDLPYLFHTGPNLITAMVCLDSMTADNGATVVFPGSHRVPPEAVTPADTDIPPERLPDNPLTVECPAGSAVLFHVNLVHGGPPNRTDAKRRNVIGIWSGPDTYPVYPHRFTYQGLMPRSRDAARQAQVRLTFGEVAWPALHAAAT